MTPEEAAYMRKLLRGPQRLESSHARSCWLREWSDWRAVEGDFVITDKGRAALAEHEGKGDAP